MSSDTNGDSLPDNSVCVRCIMDTSVPEIIFDQSGVCNFCRIHDLMETEFPLGDISVKRLNELVQKVKTEGKGKQYDCVVGVSGGTDSTYTLYRAVNLGLRPLAVHFDNGWNSETAVANIKRVTSSLDVDLVTFVADWEEFKCLQLSFLKSSTPDADQPTDMAIIATLYKIAAQERVRYILNGANFRTEGKIPMGWGYCDGRYINSVHKQFSKTTLKNIPNLTLLRLMNFLYLKRIKMIRLLQYGDYEKEKVKNLLAEEVGWQDYGGHHHENIYTRFYYCYLLPKKFHIDKRRVSMSALIRSGQMTRSAACEQIEEPPCDEDQLAQDRDYVIKKIGISPKEFSQIMESPPKTFRDFPTYFPLFSLLKSPINLLYKLKLIPTKIYE